MYCSNCGEELKNGTKFCPKCGTQVTQNIEPENRPDGRIPKNYSESQGDFKTGDIQKVKRTPVFAIGFIVIVVLAVIIIMVRTGIIGGKSDLDYLQGTWINEEGNGVILYAPYSETSGDASIIEDGDSKTASYEWHESSQRLMLYYADRWGDQVETVYEYELEDNDTLLLTPVAASDSSGSYSFSDEEAVAFYRE